MQSVFLSKKYLPMKFCVCYEKIGWKLAHACIQQKLIFLIQLEQIN